MLRPVRFVVVCLLAFTAGVFFEKGAQRDACAQAGGTMRGAICEGVLHD